MSKTHVKIKPPTSPGLKVLMDTIHLKRELVKEIPALKRGKKAGQHVLISDLSSRGRKDLYEIVAAVRAAVTDSRGRGSVRPAPRFDSATETRLVEFGSGKNTGKQRKAQEGAVLPLRYDPFQVQGAEDLLTVPSLPVGVDAVQAINSTYTHRAISDFREIDAPVKISVRSVGTPVVSVEECTVHPGEQVYVPVPIKTGDMVVGLQEECTYHPGDIKLSLRDYEVNVTIKSGEVVPPILDQPNIIPKIDYNRFVSYGIRSLKKSAERALPKLDGELTYVVAKQQRPIHYSCPSSKVEVQYPVSYTQEVKLVMEKIKGHHYLLNARVNGINLPVNQNVFDAFLRIHKKLFEALGISVSCRPFSMETDLPIDGVVYYPPSDHSWGRYYKFKHAIDFDVAVSDYQDRLLHLAETYKLSGFPPSLDGTGVYKIVYAKSGGILTFKEALLRIDKTYSDSRYKIRSVTDHAIAQKAVGGPGDRGPFSLRMRLK